MSSAGGAHVHVSVGLSSEDGGGWVVALVGGVVMLAMSVVGAVHSAGSGSGHSVYSQLGGQSMLQSGGQSVLQSNGQSVLQSQGVGGGS